MKNKTSLSRKVLEVALGLGQGTIEHSFILPTAIRKDFADEAKPEDVKLCKDDCISARQVGYLHSFVTPGWPILPTLGIALMYKEVSHIAPELVTPLIAVQVGLNTISLAYETIRFIKKAKKGEFKRYQNHGYFFVGPEDDGLRY